MAKERGCAECNQSKSNINEYSFTNLLGKYFVVYICDDCIISVTQNMESMSPTEEVAYLTNLGTRINKTFS